MHSHRLWIHPEKRRYYRAMVYQDLLGHWILMRDWGSLDSKLGGMKTELLAGLQEGCEKLEAIAKRRRSHHYQTVGENNGR